MDGGWVEGGERVEGETRGFKLWQERLLAPDVN